MESSENNKDIHKVDTMKERDEEEDFLRNLWRECFDDPVSYEDFYFNNIYRNNIVYCIPDKGMLHLNPYLCKVGDKEQLLHYIVGVATKASERRKGIMRKLIGQAFVDLYEAKAPFTYLMPADSRYYSPFAFVSISQKKEERLEGDCFEKQSGHERKDDKWKSGEKIGTDRSSLLFVEYQTLFQLYRDPDRIFQRIDSVLAKQYAIYVKHDKKYYDLLWKEKHCQDGNVIFCFEGNREPDNLRGFFAYGRGEQTFFVEQYVLKNLTIEECIRSYGLQTVTIVHQFPYMIRMIHVETALGLFAEQFRSYVGKRIWIMDSVLSENNGIYTIVQQDHQIKVQKQGLTEQMDNVLWDVKMTVAELSELIFVRQNEENNRVFFAEVV